MNSIHFNIKLVSLSQHDFISLSFTCDEFLFHQKLNVLMIFLMSEMIKTKIDLIKVYFIKH